MEPQEGPLWPQTISQSISSNDEDEDISANIYEQRIPTNNHLLNNKGKLNNRSKYKSFSFVENGKYFHSTIKHNSNKPIYKFC